MQEIMELTSSYKQKKFMYKWKKISWKINWKLTEEFLYNKAAEKISM